MSNNPGSASSSSNDDLYDRTAEELQNTLDNILSSHDQLNQRAIDLVKIDLLSASIIVTGVSINGLNFTLVFIGGLIAFLYSIWACTQVYKPRQFKRGIGRNGAINMDKDIQSGTNSEKYHRTLVYSYIKSVESAKKKHNKEKERFQDGLWASIAAILFFAFAGLGHVLGGFPPEIDIPLLFIIPIVTMWGKNNTTG